MSATLGAALLSFAAVFAAAYVLAGLAAGGARRRLRARLAAVRDYSAEDARPTLLIREQYLRRFSPLERRLEELPGMLALAKRIEQSGSTEPAYRIVLQCLACACVAGVAAALMHPVWTAALAAAGAALPLLRLEFKRRRRIGEFEQQLPTALAMMGRALRAGTPVTESFRFVGEEMRGPVADEFRTTWSHINYGVPLKTSLTELARRVPSGSLRTLTTALLVQRETGGNLAELLDAIGAVLRARFRFERRLRTLTAEGRLSARVLIVMPFALTAMLSLTSPGYMPLLTEDPTGRKMIAVALVLMALGVVWIRRTIRVRI